MRNTLFIFASCEPLTLVAWAAIQQTLSRGHLNQVLVHIGLLVESFVKETVTIFSEP